MHKRKIYGGNRQQPHRNPIIEMPILAENRGVERGRRFYEHPDSTPRCEPWIDFKNLAAEAVAVSRERFNPFASFRSEGLSQDRDLEGQVGVFDKSIGP